MSERGQNYRATWARWRERNATGWDAYEARMEAADQCLATCPTCWAQCDLPEGHLWRHAFPGKCELATHDEQFVTLEIEPDHSAFVESLGITPWQAELLRAAYRAKDDMERVMKRLEIVRWR